MSNDINVFKSEKKIKNINIIIRQIHRIYINEN